MFHLNNIFDGDHSNADWTTMEGRDEHFITENPAIMIGEKPVLLTPDEWLKFDNF